MNLLRMGSRGDDVKEVQERLNDFYEEKIALDGIFGQETYNTVCQFQDEAGLNVDGVVGPATWAALFGEPPAEETPGWPIMQADLMDLMGDPHDPGFRSNWLEFIDLDEFIGPGILPVNGMEIRNGSHGFWGNKLLKDPIKIALRNLAKEGLNKLWHTFGGCWCVRTMKGGSSLSVHSWAMAIDINPAENPFNSSRHQLTIAFLNCFIWAGFESGGMWQSPKDWMHLQLAWTRTNWAERLTGTGFEVPKVIR